MQRRLHTLLQSIDTDGKESDDSEWSSSDEDAADNADEDEEVVE